MSAAKNSTNDPADERTQGPAGHWVPGDDSGDDAQAGEVERCDEQEGATASPTRPAASDAQLGLWIEAIVDQDERALASLYDATISRVFGLVRRIVRDPALAEEVVEDAYFQVWRQAVRFEPGRGKALTWLLAMARSRAIDALRREARFQHDTIDAEDSPEVACDAAPADELLDLARHRSDLHQALMLLGAQPRQLVSMAFLRGLTHEEIAEQTRLPLGTVKSQIRRALQSLRQILDTGSAPALAS